MNKPISHWVFAATLICGMTMTSCTESIEEGMSVSEAPSIGATDSHRVNYADVVTLFKANNRATRGSADATPDIECITNATSDTLLYVCKNQEGGWTIYSSDTRVPAIVAQSADGSFDELMQIDGAKLWIQSMAEDMATIRQLEDDKLNFSQAEIENNQAFWLSISAPDIFVKENLQQGTTRAFEGELKAGGDPQVPIGHYELVSSSSHAEVYDSISRMITTYWDQGDPCNNSCPKITVDAEERALAGCVAIAGAQMLYFLHNKFGVPVLAPYSIVPPEDITKSNWGPVYYSSEIWDKMAPYGTNSDALIADVGRLVGMKYTNAGSGASTKDLVDKVFAPYGISCVYDTYNTDELKTSLSGGMPVLLRAGSQYGVGHAFIADRYRRSRTVTKNYYEWVYDYIPPGMRVPCLDPKIEYTYSSPYIGAIGINWGWGDYVGASSEWHSLTGDWISKYDPKNQNWSVERHMIYKFAVK